MQDYVNFRYLIFISKYQALS